MIEIFTAILLVAVELPLHLAAAALDAGVAIGQGRRQTHLQQ